jgi:hypothetical protein
MCVSAGAAKGINAIHSSGVSDRVASYNSLYVVY